jgi:hypothetical protein
LYGFSSIAARSYKPTIEAAILAYSDRTAAQLHETVERKAFEPVQKERLLEPAYRMLGVDAGATAEQINIQADLLIRQHPERRNEYEAARRLVVPGKRLLSAPRE